MPTITQYATFTLNLPGGYGKGSGKIQRKFFLQKIESVEGKEIAEQVKAEIKKRWPERQTTDFASRNNNLFKVGNNS